MFEYRLSYEAVFSFLSKQTSDTNRWPSDKEFKKAWLDVPIYHAITRPRLRMILIALDQSLHDSKTEQYTIKNHLTVEHLMPQLWRDHWPLSKIDGESYEDKNDRIEKRNQAIQTIGNLFYLTNSLDPYVSNGPFGDKKTREAIKQVPPQTPFFKYNRLRLTAITQYFICFSSLWYC